jgi:type IV fimbrial biogenesis protein FimT
VKNDDRQAGFTLLELMTAMALVMVIGAVAAPSFSRTYADLRLRGDSRSIHNQISVAKMRAAARFTRERLYVDTAAETYKLQFWDKAAGNWTDEGGTSQLSSGVDFGFGALTQAPPSTQSALQQSPACKDKDGNDIANTACITFNSRGVPIDSTGQPFGDNGIYLKDSLGVYGITMSASSLVRLWWSPVVTTAWSKR